MEKYRKIVNSLFVVIMLFIIFGGLGYALTQRLEINEYENRPANRFAKPQITSIIDHTFQNNIEDGLADQLPISTQLKSFYNQTTGKTVDLLNARILNQPGRYTPYHGLRKYDSHITFAPVSLEENKEKIESRISNINNIMIKNPKLNYYIYYIERDMDINFETNENTGVYDFIEENININPDNISRYKISNFEDYQKRFYETDHHWNHYGSYEAYKEVVNLILPEESPFKIKEEFCMLNSYSGTKTSGAGISDFVFEDMCAYIFELPQHQTFINGEEKVYGRKDEYLLSPPEFPSYPGVFGFDEALVHFNYNNPEKENTIIFGESFDNPIIEIIAAHYNNTYSIDLRNYSEDNAFDLDKFLEENDIDNIIFIGSITMFSNLKLNVEGY